MRIIIIGAGITGCLIAHALSKKQCEVLVLEKENDVCLGASGANSAIVHPGYDPDPHTSKAHFNVLGARMYESLCKELQVDYKQIGSYVLSEKVHDPILVRLEKQANERAIPCVCHERHQILENEPYVSDTIQSGLYFPTTAIITPWQVGIAALEEAVLNGVSVKFEHRVMAIEKKAEEFLVSCDDEVFTCDILINCAGVHADDITKLLTVCPYTIQAKKGEYVVLDHDKPAFVHHVLFPVPTSNSKGVLIVPTIHENVLVGPNSLFCEDRDDVDTTDALDQVLMDAKRLIPNIPLHRQIHSYAGMRPSSDLHDFYIQEDENVKNFIHVACIESPGLASSPAIAKYVTETLLKLEDKPSYIRRRPWITMENMSDKQKDELIKKDSDFSKVICRCEKITLGQIKDLFDRPLAPVTIKGINRRCRTGMGACQGGFCEEKLVKILASYGIDAHVNVKEMKSGDQNV